VYPASEPDSWIALSVWDDAEWSRLREALGDPEWAREASLASAAGRRAKEGWIDSRIGEWSSRQPRASAVTRLRSRGLRAAPVETVGELFVDAQLSERRAWRLASHPVIGDMRLMAAPFLLSGSEQGPHEPGPLLAQHTEDVFRGIVGLDAAEYAALEAQGVFK
jgi:benzylsuccinate CoA-transferase BbsF subunit